MLKKILLSLISLSIGVTFLLDETLVREIFEIEKDKVLTLEVLVLAMYLFVSELVRVDVVGILMMVLLPLLGLIPPEKSISGLSSNAVVSIIAVIIIGTGLDKTGVMNIIANYIIRLAGKSKTRIITLISGTVALISSFMQNIGAAALFLPAVVRISRRLRVPVSHLLMPMGFSAILGGTITLVGSSPLILLNDLLSLYELPPFHLFSVTPIGLSLAFVGILYFVVFGRFILPKTEKGEDEGKFLPPDLAQTYDRVCGLYELHVPVNFQRRTVEEIDARRKYQVTIVAVYHRKTRSKTFAPHREETIEPSDDMVVIGCPDTVDRFAKELGLILKGELEEFADDLSNVNAGLVEGIVTPRSELVGRTLKEVHFRRRYEVNPVALVRRGEVIYAGFSDMELMPGDALLLFGKWDKLLELKNRNIFAFSTEIKGEVMRPEKAKLALFWFALAIVMILVFHIKLSIALLTGALGMVLTRVMSIDEAYQSVDWMTVFLLAGLLPLGMAFQETGTAEFLANRIVSSIEELTPFTLYLLVALLTSFFTLVVSNVGATVLLVPLSVDMALDVGADPRVAALVVGVSASNTFIIPTHQVNALIMRPGGYRTIDYVKAGGGMTILFILTLMAGIYLFYR
ncbi:TrkA family protein [Hydrogenivirga caldilitoris]|uniref:TrkA family protein n=1 Tax=Hydrogenivirga caldilitoris TaxID=246264 RepID=A0A497XN18_9AQUI|nr:SLC13 family permease [Hydrogenivirga caldilitoris]RLJ70248.1 TrkA family protein [Hydrogenivirga caldilitoris]